MRSLKCVSFSDLSGCSRQGLTLRSDPSRCEHRGVCGQDRGNSPHDSCILLCRRGKGMNLLPCTRPQSAHPLDMSNKQLLCNNFKSNSLQTGYLTRALLCARLFPTIIYITHGWKHFLEYLALAYFLSPL